MSSVAATAEIGASQRFMTSTGAQGLYNSFAGLAILFVLWWIGIYLIITLDPDDGAFRRLRPHSRLPRDPSDVGGVESSWSAIWASGYRLTPGYHRHRRRRADRHPHGPQQTFAELSNSPFQLLRMISPLSWEPIAVIVFVDGTRRSSSRRGRAVWPVAFATAAGLAKVDPAWFKVARNLGAKPWHVLTKIIVPAIAFDVITGIRSAPGVA